MIYILINDNLSTFFIKIYKLFIKEQLFQYYQQMRRSSNLPSLQLNPSPSTKLHAPHHQSKESVKFLESKISKHETDIQRNQKIIISLTNQFRLIKDELKTQQNQNEELSQMYRRSTDENQKLLKNNKQLRIAFGRLQKTMQETAVRQRQQNNTVAMNKNKILQQEVTLLKQQLTSKNKQARVLEVTNRQLIKENDVLRSKEKQHKNKEYTSKNNLQNEIEEMKKNHQNSLTELKVIIDEQNKQLKELEKVNQKLVMVQKQINQKNRQMKNLQVLFKQTKSTLTLKTQQLKLSRDRIIELENMLKKTGNSESRNTDLLKKIQNLQMSETQSTLKLTDLKQKYQKLTLQFTEQIKRNDLKVRTVKKIVKNKSSLTKCISKIRQSILCSYCGKAMQKTVTNIPCGHSYCFECKKGYQKQCRKCVNVKREAVYRNQLMDQVINAYNAIKDISESLNKLGDEQQ